MGQPTKIEQIKNAVSNFFYRIYYRIFVKPYLDDIFGKREYWCDFILTANTLGALLSDDKVTEKEVEDYIEFFKNEYKNRN